MAYQSKYFTIYLFKIKFIQFLHIKPCVFHQFQTDWDFFIKNFLVDCVKILKKVGQILAEIYLKKGI